MIFNDHIPASPSLIIKALPSGGGGITSEATPNPMDRTHWYGEGQRLLFRRTPQHTLIRVARITMLALIILRIKIIV